MRKPVLTTDRLELWQPVAADEPAISAIANDPRTRRFLGGHGDRADSFTRFQRNAGSWFLFGYGVFMLRLKGRTDILGNCGVFHSYRGLGTDFDDKPEAGWILGPDHGRQGFAHEAMSAALAWFDEVHGPRKVVCMIHPDNAPSISLARKLGFEPTRAATFGEDEAVQLFRRVHTAGAGSAE